MRANSCVHTQWLKGLGAMLTLWQSENTSNNVAKYVTECLLMCVCVCVCLSHMINQRHLALIGNSLREQLAKPKCQRQEFANIGQESVKQEEAAAQTKKTYHLYQFK